MIPQPTEPRAKAAGGSAHAASVKATLKNFRIVFSSVRKHFAWLEQSCGIGGASVWALAVIGKTPGMRVTDLAESLSIHQSTASNLLERLIREGYAKRRRDTEDQRVVRLELTAKGRKLLQRAPQPVEGVLPDALARLPADVLERLKVDLDALIQAMQVKDDRAAFRPLADL